VRTVVWREPVVSSAIRSVGYDPERCVLEIEFNSGSVYQYFGVPPDTHRQLMDAASRGKYFEQFVRDVFDYRQVQ
jgi:hypothetical protein